MRVYQNYYKKIYSSNIKIVFVFVKYKNDKSIIRRAKINSTN